MKKESLAQRVMQLTTVKIVKKLSEMLRPVSAKEDADAAVALLLKPKDDSLSVLFVKRVNSPSDPWSGQTALPGGKREPNDKDLKQTVIRETLEETNINLEDDCRFLGTTRIEHSTPRTEMRILPFVVFLEHEPTIRLNENELERCAWIPLKELTKHRGTAKFSFGESPAYIIDDHVIWGLTYRIVEEFLHAIG
jgi:8-oxo-dGTP pyrophosphatase MutT (NUDIX family)